MIDSGADVNATFRPSRHGDGGDRETALHLVAGDARLNCVRLLLSAHASLSIRTVKGRTALHEACRIRSRKVVQELLRAGADISGAFCFVRSLFISSLSPVTQRFLTKCC